MAADNAAEAEPAWDEHLDAGHAAEVLERLAPHYRLALTLRYLDDLAVPSIAALLDRGVHSTESLLVRARRAFRDAYEERGGRRGH